MSILFTQDLKLTFAPTEKQLCYIMSHPNETSKYILNTGIFEKPLIGWAIENYKNSEKVFLDIGAHMGTYAINLAPYFKHTYAFEAQKKTYYCLTGGIAMNDLCEKVTAYHCAVTNYENSGKEITLNVGSQDGGGSTITHFNLPTNLIREEKIIAKNIDEFDIKDIGLIKIDVEGAELDALKGAAKTLEMNDYPPILFEAWSEAWYDKQREELFKYLRSHGYRMARVYSNNMYLATRD